MIATYRLDEEPPYVLDEGAGPLPGHYEASFVNEDGVRVLRFLTDKGRAEVIRRLGSGGHVFSQEEILEWTVEPDIERLVVQMEYESGEGG